MAFPFSARLHSAARHGLQAFVAHVADRRTQAALDRPDPFWQVCPTHCRKTQAPIGGSATSSSAGAHNAEVGLACAVLVDPHLPAPIVTGCRFTGVSLLVRAGCSR